MQAGVAGERRDLLVQARVVLHRARAERVRPRVEVEVPARDAVVVADDLGLGDLGELGGLLAKEVLRDQLGERGLGHVALGHDGRAPALDRALEDRARLVALHRRRDLGGARGLHERTSAVSRLVARARDRRLERARQAVDVGLRPALGDRDEEAVLVLGVVAAERVAGGDAVVGAAVEHLLDRGVERDRELAGNRRIVEELDAVDRGERLPRVGGAPDHELAELDQAALAEPDEVEDAAERDQRLRGADVVGRLLAADVLLARLQREDEAAPAVDVGGLAGDPARHAADVLLGRAEEAERRAAEVEAAAERLPLPHRDVDPALARRPEHAQGHRVDRGDRHRAGVVRR